jgi:hypothetical protein
MIPAARCEALCDGAGAAVGCGRSFGLAGEDDTLEGGIVGDFKAQPDGRWRDIARPENDACLRGLAGGDAMGEAARWLREGAAGENGGEKASATRGK